FTTTNCKYIAFADIDGDGHVDGVTNLSVDDNGSGYIMFGTPSGFGGYESMIAADTVLEDNVVGTSFQHMTIGDLTGDGIPEVVFCPSNFSNGCLIFLGGTSNWGTNAARPATVQFSSLTGA